MTDSSLNTCGCCEGVDAETPREVYNRPGLDAISYRIGTHARFKESMLARLSGAGLAGAHLGESLRTRDDDDFSIALIDAWATVADVLTFYQERIANESYLRTAAERVSLLYLARLIGYELRPGVAASTYLAFKLDEAPGLAGQPMPGLPDRVTLGIGTRVQSVPAPGEQAQIFETTEAIEARVAWNALRPRLTRRQPRTSTTTTLVFEGIATGLKPGDALLVPLDTPGSHVFRQVAEVLVQPEAQRTTVRLATAPSATFTTITLPSALPAAPAPSAWFQTLANTIRAVDLEVIAQTEGFVVQALFDNLAAARPAPPTVFALRTRAAIFGHNAPKLGTLPYSQRVAEAVFAPTAGGQGTFVATTVAGPYASRTNTWAEAKLDVYLAFLVSSQEEPANTPAIFLDTVYNTISKNSYVVLKDRAQLQAYRVEANDEVSKSDFTLSAKTSRLTLNTSAGFGSFGIRSTTVWGQPEELVLARLPLDTPINTKVIELDGWVDGLRIGQSVIIHGESATDHGVFASERAILADVEHLLEPEGCTRITLDEAPRNSYVRASVTISASVAHATHGESTAEVLGSGDGSRSYQRWTLRQPPLTYVSADTPSGARSTLDVRVNDVLWHEVPSLFGHGPDERVYATRRADDGRTTVEFGDGRTGARLPTGPENVRATYRRGIGLGGLVKAEQITLLMARPLGLREVTNPLAPDGAADPETRDEARRNAPLTVMTLDRIVSLQDYEDFARAYIGIAKSLATWTWNGSAREVFVTVAGPLGAEVKDGSTLHTNLTAAMLKAGDPLIPLRVKSYNPAFFKLAASVKRDPDYLEEGVRAAVETALRARFGFDARAFGQPVTLSEVIAVIQKVPGVIATNVTRLHRSLVDPDEIPPPLLTADLPRAGVNNDVAAAELLMLDPGPLGELVVHV